jgi:minor extracellular serine protease Vpr
VTVSIAASAVPSSLVGADQHRFRQVSGNVLFSSDAGSLSVPYLMVPRSLSNLTATASALFKPDEKGTTMTLSNAGGAITSALDFYTWGLADADDVNEAADGNSGFDVRAVGVQSFPANADGSNQLLVFAVNNWSRYSNASTAEYDILIDVDGDRTNDFAVFAVDSGAVRAGSFNGLMEVFFADLHTGGLFASGYLAASPTDSSTVLLPVETADLGITGGFKYSAVSFSITSDGVDPVGGVAGYNPWVKAFPEWDGAFPILAPGATQQHTVFVDHAAYEYGKPRGLMAVAYDNAAGAGEAILLRSRN